MKDKISELYKEYGIAEQGFCKDCDNLIAVQSGKKYYKCRVYGVSASASTDWKVNQVACGMFNKEFNGIPIYKKRIRIEESQCDGQIQLNLKSEDRSLTEKNE